MKKVIVIPARYGSTRLPGKPLREISGKPVIQWVYEKAQSSGLKDEVLIATDDERIRDAAASFGADVVMTRPDCKSGTDRVYEAIKGRKADIIVNLQGDEPFIRADIIDSLFYAMEKEHLHMATTCSPIKDETEYQNPNIVKVVLDRFGFALYFSRSPIPYLRNAKIFCGVEIQNPQSAIRNPQSAIRNPQSAIRNPQSAIRNPQSAIRNPKCIYKHIGIYGFSREFLERYVGMETGILEETESLEQLRVLENGYDIKVLITDYDGFGIDTEDDLCHAWRMLDQGALKNIIK